MKKHLGFILFFTAIIFIFLGKLIFMKSAFLYGDYLQQFYPWSKVYSEAIRNFSFPFWTRYVNSGFPLMAEGQVGGFYPLNILMFFLLPFNLAYNYSIILHFILGGIFAYIYSRKIGADQWGGLLSALLFCFGSSYAGCFYNIITLRTLVWFPLGLFLIEKYFNDRRLRWCLWLGLVFGMQLLAGFFQMAAYSIFFYLTYFIYGLALRKKIKIIDIAKIGLAFFVAAVLFYPQLILSLKMASLSYRAQSALDFALWGSFSPLNLIGLYFPSLILWGSQLYVGVFSLIFFITALSYLKKESKIKPVFAVLVVAAFFALGAYNPIYVFLLKITRFYSFRNPSKFIFFVVFAISVLSGWGFTQFFVLKSKETKSKILNIFSISIGCMLLVFVSIKLIFIFFKNSIINAGIWYVKHYVIGKSHHRYDFNTYIAKINSFYNQFASAIDLGNVFIVMSLLLCIVSVIFLRYLIKHPGTFKIQKPIIIGIILVDLFVFSFFGTGFTVNDKPFNYLKPTHNNILTILRSDKGLFRVMPFGLVDKNMPWWMMPSANMLVGLDNIASYSPLAQKEYREELLPLEIVDNSLGLLYPKENALSDKQTLLRIFNVKYIISVQTLNHDFLEKIAEEEGVYLYKLKDYLPRVFFVKDLTEEIKYVPAVINITKYNNGYIEANLDCNSPGFFVFSENYYPGWEAFVDGKKKENIKFKNLIQAVAVTNGKHKVIFKYRPF